MHEISKVREMAKATSEELQELKKMFSELLKETKEHAVASVVFDIMTHDRLRKLEANT